MVDVTCRTEYLSSRNQLGARAAWVALLATLIAFVALRIAGVDGSAIALIAFAGIAVSLACAAWGRLGRRDAVLLSVDDGTVTLGREGDGMSSYPVSSVVSVTTDGPAKSTTMNGRNLTVDGLKFLTIEFVAAGAGGPDAATDIWQVAVVDSDPAAATVIGRLRPRVSSHAKHAAATTSASTTPASTTTPTADPAAATVLDTESGYDAPRIATAGSDEAAQRLWESATARHDQILGAYGTYELDPSLMLRYPGVTDVTLDQVQDFHDALSAAQALRTERYPGDRNTADTYQQAIRALSRAWTRCEKQGRALGTGYLGQAERDGLDTALKLVNHAQGSVTESEQAAYYERAHRIVTDLADAGNLHPPAAAVESLKASAQRAITRGI